MGVTQTPKQCQSKWCVLRSFIILSCPCNSAGLTPLKGKCEMWHWKEDDSYVLICKCVSCAVDFVLANYQVHRIASLDVDNKDDIDWKSLNDPTWNMWSGHYLQQKWRQLKASCNANSIMCHHGGYTTFILFRFSTSCS